MYTIAFDTTAAGCSVALTQDERVLGRYVEQMDFGQAEVLIPAIQNLLNVPVFRRLALLGWLVLN